MGGSINYEGSGIVRHKKKRKDGKEEEEVKRGYKLGSLRSLLDDVRSHWHWQAVVLHIAVCHVSF
jgi:hypothetical protein